MYNNVAVLKCGLQFLPSFDLRATAAALFRGLFRDDSSMHLNILVFFRLKKSIQNCCLNLQPGATGPECLMLLISLGSSNGNTSRQSSQGDSETPQSRNPFFAPKTLIFRVCILSAFGAFSVQRLRKDFSKRDS